MPSHKQKKFQTLLIRYLILLAILVIFLFSVGFKLLLNLGIFISNVSHKNDTTQSQNNPDQFLLPPTIDDLPDATNSASIKISGQATSGKTLSLYVNGNKEEDAYLTDNEYNINVKLKKGDNEIYLTLQDDKTKNKKESAHYHVVYKSEKPKLIISSPKDGDTVSRPEVTIQGSTDKDVTISINDAPVVVDAQQNFSYTITLQQGDNQVKIYAEDEAGNNETQQMIIKYQKED